MERRQAERCPICQGPAKDQNGTVRCRNSTCKFNHQDEACPRCGEKSIGDIRFEKGHYSFTCRDCQKTWTKAETN